MKVQELTEGPLDDLVKKVKSWVDVDSRQLDNLANQISGPTSALVKRSNSNVTQVKPDELPFERIAVSAFAIASKLTSNIAAGQIDPVKLQAYFAKNQATIIKNLNADAPGGSHAAEAAAQLKNFIEKKPMTPIAAGLSFDASVKAISVVVAATVLDWEFNALTNNANPTANGTPFAFEDKDLQPFEAAGDKINAEMFTPGSELLNTLSVNPDLAETLKNFVVHLVSYVDQRIADIPTVQLQALAAKPQAAVNAGMLQATLLGHLAPAAQTPELRSTVSKAVTTLMTDFNEFFVSWFNLALIERTAGREKSDEAYEQFVAWGKKALELIGTVKQAKTTNKAAPENLPPQVDSIKKAVQNLNPEQRNELIQSLFSDGTLNPKGRTP